MQLEAEVGFSIGEVENAVHAGIKRHSKEKPKPFYLRRSNAKIQTAVGTTTTIGLGSPPAGRMWQVTLLTLFGADDHTAVAAVTGAVYIGQSNAPSLGGLCFPGLLFPSSLPVSDDNIWVHSNESLLIVANGTLTAGMQLGANATILEWREGEITSQAGY